MNMQVIHFRPDHVPELADAEAVATDGFHWLDIERSESDWEEKALPWLGARLDDRHVQDLLVDRIADALLSSREKTSELLTEWQERLLNHADQFDDWRSLYRSTSPPMLSTPMRS